MHTNKFRVRASRRDSSFILDYDGKPVLREEDYDGKTVFLWRGRLRLRKKRILRAREGLRSALLHMWSTNITRTTNSPLVWCRRSTWMANEPSGTAAVVWMYIRRDLHVRSRFKISKRKVQKVLELSTRTASSLPVANGFSEASPERRSVERHNKGI